MKFAPILEERERQPATPAPLPVPLEVGVVVAAAVVEEGMVREVRLTVADSIAVVTLGTRMLASNVANQDTTPTTVQIDEDKDLAVRCSIFGRLSLLSSLS